jgi:hypothetical protein
VAACGYRKSHLGWRSCRDGLLSSPGWIDLLKLLGGLLVGVFRSHTAREAEMAFLRKQLVVLLAIRAGEAQAALCRSLDLRLALSAVTLLA